MTAGTEFTGPALTFKVEGAGASIDPDTRVLHIPDTTLQAGFDVVVTAEDAGRTASSRIRVGVATASVVPVPPAMSAAPMLSGSGRIGEAVTLDPGSWTGTPTPELAVRWLRDGVPVAGANGPVHTPGLEDDGAALTARVVASNAAGEAMAETSPLAVTRVPPTVASAMTDRAFAQGSGAQVVEARGAFAGQGLVFAVSGAGASIDLATGRLSIPTDALLAAVEITVTASNSGGAASVRFRVTVGAAVVPIIGAKAIETPGAGITIEQFLVRSTKSGRDITLRVMLPNGYAAGSARYPVLYTLNGQSSPLDTFTGMVNLRSAMATKPMIVVTFDNDAQDDGVVNGGDCWYIDSPILPKSQFTSFFRDELVPFIDAHYRTGGASKRGVTGFSMGAWGAMHYLCECSPGTFNSVSGMSGAYLAYATTATFMNPVLGTRASNPARWRALELDRRINARLAAGHAVPPLMLTVGLSDTLQGTRAFRDFLLSKGLTPEYDERPGAHDYANWSVIITKIVDFHWRKFNM